VPGVDVVELLCRLPLPVDGRLATEVTRHGVAEELRVRAIPGESLIPAQRYRRPITSIEFG
jgi:hypothetical protein